MQRDINNTLCSWKSDSARRPLLLRGARQVGKSYSVSEFGKKEFGSFVVLNFEKNPEYKEIFSTNIPSEIIEKIALFTGKKITPGGTLLFLDEVQECPSAIMAMRYFFEEMPQLHVIAAGSLLEFTLESADFRMPVGRIQYLYMYPLSFGEFLCAIGEEELRAHIKIRENLAALPDALHNKLNELVRKYFLIGGMPAVVGDYCARHDILKCQRIQRSIIDTYHDDFGKYAGKSTHSHLNTVFHSVAAMTGQRFVYAHVDQTVKSRELKNALELLEMAGVVRKIKRTTGAGLPLEAGASDTVFKVFFMDIGLLHAENGIYGETAKAHDFTALFNGAIGEQFVGGELLAYLDPYTKQSLYYWGRDAKNSNAEVDYLVQKGNAVVPVEVKSGTGGRLKSLNMFIGMYETTAAVKISQGRYSENGVLTSLPFYAMEGFFRQ
jgi:hypothetical protein